MTAKYARRLVMGYPIDEYSISFISPGGLRNEKIVNW